MTCGHVPPKFLPLVFSRLARFARLLMGNCRVVSRRKTCHSPIFSLHSASTDFQIWLLHSLFCTACIAVRIATMGNVDAGKSTLVGVLTSGRLDDGRGLARARVFRMQVQYARNGRHLHSRTAISCKRTAICLQARSNSIFPPQTISLSFAL